MASSDVDQKFLGRYARDLGNVNPFLSSMLYKVLGMSVLLSKKLIRARRLRRLDTTRDTKSLQLYHHIIWLAREGLTILEECILPLVDNYGRELRVLSHKLRASFYHIFVLFHNQPSIHITSIPSGNPSAKSTLDHNLSFRRKTTDLQGRPINDPGPLPPGLAPISIPKPSATFLLPARNYIPDASSYFSHASELADAYLFGSHPIRLSVKTEYSAYLYDCLHDGEASRKLAQAAIRDVYNAPEGMDDESFEDAAEMVGILGKMMRRGLRKEKGQSGGAATPAAAAAAPAEASPSRRKSKGGSSSGEGQKRGSGSPAGEKSRSNSGGGGGGGGSAHRERRSGSGSGSGNSNGSGTHSRSRRSSGGGGADPGSGTASLLPAPAIASAETRSTRTTPGSSSTPRIRDTTSRSSPEVPSSSGTVRKKRSGR